VAILDDNNKTGLPIAIPRPIAGSENTPTPPNVAFLYFSNARNNLRVLGGTIGEIGDKISLYIDGTLVAQSSAAPDGGFADGSFPIFSLPTTFADGATISYSVTNSAGVESTIVPNGTIPVFNLNTNSLGLVLNGQTGNHHVIFFNSLGFASTDIITLYTETTHTKTNVSFPGNSGVGSIADDLTSNPVNGGEPVEYSLMDSYGNESALVSDGNIPLVIVTPSLNRLKLSIYKEEIAYSASISIASNENLYLALRIFDGSLNDVYMTANSFIDNNAGFLSYVDFINPSGANLTVINPDKSIFFSIINSDGNQSPETAFGTVPSPPTFDDLKNIGYSKTFNQVIEKTVGGIAPSYPISLTTTSDTINIYNDNTGGFHGSSPVFSSYNEGDIIIDNVAPLLDGATVTYTYSTNNGIESDGASDGIVSIPPENNETNGAFSCSAYLKEVNSLEIFSHPDLDGVNQGFLYVYKNLDQLRDPSNLIAKSGLSGFNNIVTLPFETTATVASENKIYYTIVNNDGNESAWNPNVTAIPTNPASIILRVSSAENPPFRKILAFLWVCPNSIR
jgi:hypothetical protein